MADRGPHLRIRLPEYLLERMRAEAAANGRTLTGEIVKRLESTLDVVMVPRAKLQKLYDELHG